MIETIKKTSFKSDNRDNGSQVEVPSLKINNDKILVNGYQIFELNQKNNNVDIKSRHKKINHILPIFKRILEKHNCKSFADIGCNNGLYSFLALNIGYEKIYSLDHDVDCIKLINEIINLKNLSKTMLSKEYKFGDSMEKSDLVFCGAIIHWIFSLTAKFFNFDNIINYLMKYTNEYLIIEWISENDSSIRAFDHINKGINNGDDKNKYEEYNTENFEKAIKKLGIIEEKIYWEGNERVFYVIRKKIFNKDDAIYQLKKNGYVVLSNFLDKSEVKNVKSKILEYFDTQDKNKLANHGNWVNILNLSLKIPEFKEMEENILESELIKSINKEINDDVILRIDTARVSQDREVIDKYPEIETKTDLKKLIHNTETPLNWHSDSMGESIIGIFFDDMLKENMGQTSIISGSHLFNSEPYKHMFIPESFCEKYFYLWAKERIGYPDWAFGEYWNANKERNLKALVAPGGPIRQKYNSVVNDTNINTDYLKNIYNEISKHNIKNKLNNFDLKYNTELIDQIIKRKNCIKGEAGDIYIFLNECWHGRAECNDNNVHINARINLFSTNNFKFKNDNEILNQNSSGIIKKYVDKTTEIIPIGENGEKKCYYQEIYDIQKDKSHPDFNKFNDLLKKANDEKAQLFHKLISKNLSQEVLLYYEKYLL